VAVRVAGSRNTAVMSTGAVPFRISSVLPAAQNGLFKIVLASSISYVRLTVIVIVCPGLRATLDIALPPFFMERLWMLQYAYPKVFRAHICN
jgi:hypothetical protein